MMSEWPLRYLVAECMTMSAPCSIGRVSTGVPTVESTASSAPARWAMSAAAAMSVTHQVGLAGVSIQTSLVAPGRTAAAMASVRSASTKSTFEAPLRGEARQPVAQRPVHHLGRHDMAARRQGQEAGGGRAHARGEDQRLGARLRGRPASPRPDRRSDCRRAHRCGRSDSRCPRRADRCWPYGSAAPRPWSPDRSSPSLGRRARRRRRSCLSSRHR